VGGAAARADWTLDYGASLLALEQIDVPPVHELGYSGAGVLVGMLDTGFRTTHDAFAHLPVVATHDVVNDDDNVDTEPGDPPGTHGHGTEVLSALAGYAPGEMMGSAYGVSVVLVRANSADDEENLAEDWWVAGLEWAEGQGVDIVSSSLGFDEDWHEFSDLDGDTTAPTIAADLAAAHGVVVINAAGNSRGTAFNHIVAPADGDSVIAVGAVDSTGTYTFFSSPGPTYDARIKPDVMALGLDVTVVDPDEDEGYTVGAGTSLSAPLAAGVAALLLERIPDLTPMQVREALRMTGSRAHAPNYDYGWGIIDAAEALIYWGPHLEHTPLTDTEDTTSPYTVTATITDRLTELDPAQLVLWHRADSGPWQSAVLQPVGDDQYAADIPNQPGETVFDYYLEAGDQADIVTRLPLTAPAELFTFTAGPDLVPPELAHTPLGDQFLVEWPPTLSATASDQFGVDRVEVTFTLDGGPLQGPFQLEPGEDDAWSLPFPLAADELHDGDQISYTVTAVDGSVAGNTTSSGPHDFAIIDAEILVLVIDDGEAADPVAMRVPYRQPLPPRAGRGSADLIAGWLADAGYGVEVLPADEVTGDDFTGRQVVVLSSGSNSTPIAAAEMRLALRDWLTAGGRLLVEGGEIGYAATHVPAYAAFASEVLHVEDWVADNGATLTPAEGLEEHPLLQTPHPLTMPLVVAYQSFGDQDCVQPLDPAFRVLVPSGHAFAAGLVIYDDTPSWLQSQMIYLPFAVASLEDPEQARLLVQNALANLLADESQTSAIAGPPWAARLVGNAPNPFNPRTTLTFALARPGRVELGIYDLRGRLVRRLLDSRQGAGYHSVAWDGRDASGRGVSSGPYVARLRAGGSVQHHKMLLLR
jgi:subtilisin family serine protease